jgi:diketogulonate reductase-like aldo/keto reductase
VFLETKVWISDYGYDPTLRAFDKSAGKLGVDRLDLLLLHQPLSGRFDLTLDAYRALEKLMADGRVRAIGVSNFMPEHLDRLLTETSVVPAVNQVELHPYFHQTSLQGVHAEHGILTQAWSPIGGITSYGGGERSAFDDPTLLEIARQHGKSAAQVMLRWHLQEGRAALACVHRRGLRRGETLRASPRNRVWPGGDLSPPSCSCPAFSVLPRCYGPPLCLGATTLAL